MAYRGKVWGGIKAREVITAWLDVPAFRDGNSVKTKRGYRRHVANYNACKTLDKTQA